MPNYSERPSVIFPDVWDWITALPSPSEWKSDAMSLKLWNGFEVPLRLSAKRSSLSQNIILSLLSYFPCQFSMWTSEEFKLVHGDVREEGDVQSLSHFIDGILHYDPQEKSMHRIESCINSIAIEADLKHFKGVFNCAFLCMALCGCIHEAPSEIQPRCLEVLERELRGAFTFKQLLESVGGNIEERVMRSMAFILTYYIMNATFADDPFKNTPLCHTYSDSTKGLWKVRVYAPVLAMKTHGKQPTTAPKDCLLFALRYLHVEAGLQLSYDLVFTPDWIEVRVAVDNVRCDVVQLATEAVLESHGVDEEKHFPSRISVRVGPQNESNTTSISLKRSSNNPSYEITKEMGVETGFEVPGKYSLTVSATKGSMTSLKPWKMEQLVRGNQGNYDQVLYDSQSGKEVAASKPSRIKMLLQNAWFRGRCSSAFRPFTKQGGVVFARDEYPDCINWRVKPEMEGQTLEWEIAGSIWLTYWPNKYKTFTVKPDISTSLRTSNYLLYASPAVDPAFE